MADINPSILKSQAKTRLQSGNATKLVLIHTGLLLILSIIASGINLFLDEQISTTGGLGGLGLRTTLQSIQSFIRYGMVLFSPFWHAGFTVAILRIAKGQKASPSDFLGGFRRWGAILGLQLFQMILMLCIAVSCAYIASVIFALTPFAAPLAEAIEPIMASGVLDLASIDAEVLAQAYIPLLIIYALILLPLLLLASLAIRLSNYLILDHKLPAFPSIYFSILAMRGHMIKMLKLDISFLWYYLVELALSVVCYLDWILPAFGVTLPFNETIAFFAALLLYSVLELAFHLWKKPYRDTSYALAYLEILHSLETPKTSE